MSNQKKIKPGNIIMDCIIAGAVLVLLIVLGTTFWNNKKEDTAQDKVKTESTALPASMPKGNGIENYECVINDENSNNTVFYISFNTNDMTFEETLLAKDQSSTLDKGSYKEENGKYITTSEKSKKEHSYAKDGNYLVVESELFEGEVPDEDTFKGTFVYEVPDEVRTTIAFNLDGTYQQEVLSYAAGTDSQDAKQVTTGTYKRKGKFIQRKADNNEPLLDFYIYNNKISNAYYKLVK